MTAPKSRRGEVASRRHSHPNTAASGHKAYNSGQNYENIFLTNELAKWITEPLQYSVTISIIITTSLLLNYNQLQLHKLVEFEILVE